MTDARRQEYQLKMALWMVLTELAVRIEVDTLTPERELELWEAIFRADYRGTVWV